MEKYWYDAAVTEVYDGDTITMDIDLGFNIWSRNQKFRLYGIDAPEIRGDERPAGLISRDALSSQILGKSVRIHTFKDRKDKYGRWLCDVYLEVEGQYKNINDWMIQSGFANIYLETIK